jgi:glucose/arabinose dehydrogenase
MRRLVIGLVVVGALLVLPSSPAAADPTLAVDPAFVTGLDHPWDLGFLPDGTMFFTQRSGQVSVRLPNGTVNEIVAPTDVVDGGGEGGMLGIAVDPQFATRRLIFVCYSSDAPPGDAFDNRVVRYKVNETFDGFSGTRAIITGMPHTANAGGRHSGCRPRFGPDGNLWIGTGDAAQGVNPQSKTSLGGKVLRVTRSGNGVVGNKGVDKPSSGWNPRIYTRGHRNVQGLCFRPNGQAFSVEHGTGRDDEVNLLVAGANYGWDPVPGYNEQVAMTDLQKFPKAKVAKWTSGPSTIAPSGCTFLAGAQWENWNGALAMAVLKNTEVRLLFPDGAGNIPAGGDVIPAALNLGIRLRSAVQGPDGNLYLATDVGSPNGAIWKVTPS